MSPSFTCIIVDDEPLARTLLKTHIAQVPQLQLVASCANALEAASVLNEQNIDLLFLDIQMPVLTGLEFLQSLSQAPQVIFTTAHREYAVESYELNGLDYLLKPIAFPRFYKAVSRFLANHSASQTSASPPAATVPTEGSLFVNVNKKQVRIQLRDIRYVESLKDYLRIVTAQERIVTRETLTAFLDRLPDNFCRVHRSYLVNLDHITAYTQQDVEIGDWEIPIGQHYKLAIMMRLQG